MEYVEGTTLDALLTSGGPVTPSRAVAYIAQAAAGLQHAYEKGFVHRDIKPANLILTRDGVVKILDMGLARSSTQEHDKLTQQLDQGTVLGTVDFVSPEQALGVAEIDIRSDIYSLGATFFTLVRGQPPFEGNSTQKLAQLQSREAPDLAELDATFPPQLAAVVAMMLAKKPRDRFQTPADVIDALAPWLSRDEGVKVVAGLSGADPVATGKIQTTITQIVAGQSKKRKRSQHEDGAAGSKKLLWGSIATLVLVAIVGLCYVLTGNRTGTPSVDRGPGISGPQYPNFNPGQQRPQGGRNVPMAVAGNTARIEFANFSKTRELVQGRTVFIRSLGGQALPPGWEINHYSDQAEAEYVFTDVGGVRVLGLKSIAGGAGTQVLCMLDDLIGRLPAGERVTIQVEYQYEGTNPGAVEIQLHSQPYPRLVEVNLEPTTGSWRTTEITFTQPDDFGPYAMTLNTGRLTAGGTLWVKSISARVGATQN
jgi:hypothetical protein